MSQLTLIGATGPSGKSLIHQALNRGHTLVIYARSPQKLAADIREHKNIRIVEGTLETYEVLVSAIQGSASVLCIISPMTDALPKWLGGNGKSRTLTAGHLNIFKAMSEVGVRRFIGIGSPSVADPNDKSSLVMNVMVRIMKIVASNVWDDENASAALMRSAEWMQKIDWTWIRIPTLGDGASNAYKLGYMGEGGGILPIVGREELAKAMLDEVVAGRWVHKMPFCWV